MRIQDVIGIIELELLDTISVRSLEEMSIDY